MKLVIDIDEHTYETIINGGTVWSVRLCNTIRNGTPLPKGHGDLIDRNDLLKHYDSTTYHNGIEERKIHFVQIGYVNDAKPIIEADQEASDG